MGPQAGNTGCGVRRRLPGYLLGSQASTWLLPRTVFRAVIALLCLTTLSFGRPLGNCGAHFGYNGCIPSCTGCDMRGVGETYKRIQYPLLHSARAHCLAALAVTPQGHENRRLPLRTHMSSRITSHHLPIVLLAPEER
jgi:hypothetical protein